MNHSDRYVRDTTTIDGLLTEANFVRICNYGQRVTNADTAGLRDKLLVETKERPMHNFLAHHLHLVVNAEFAHGCRWIKSNPSLGNEYRPDFAIARRDSGGLRWTLMELQDPQVDLFLGNGLQGEELREGLQQIGQWRQWIRSWGENGVERFGYPGLRDDFRAVLVIGRSSNKQQDLHGNKLIAALEREHRTEIRSYDYILRAAQNAVDFSCGIDHVTGRQD